MGIFDKLFGRRKKIQQHQEANHSHSVIIHFKYGMDSLHPIHQLENILERIMIDNKLGVYDGHEIAVDYSDGYLYFNGKDADEIFKAVKPILLIVDFMKGAKATLHYGKHQDDKTEIEII